MDIEKKSAMINCKSDSSLNIDFTQVVGYPCSVSIRPWQEGISWSSTSAGETTHYHYSGEISIPLSFLINDCRARPWVESIPSEILRVLEDYDAKYRNVAFSTLWFISRDNHAYEYFLNQPRITWLLLRHAKLVNWHEAYVTFLFTQKRKNILAACGLPPKKSCMNFLAKLSFPTYRRKEFEITRKMLTTSDYTRFRHLKIVDDEILSFLNEYPELTYSRLALNYDARWNLWDLRRTISDTNRMAGMLGIENIKVRIGNCRNPLGICKLHDRLSDLINEKEISAVPAVAYPRPPISGTYAIIPITNFKELVIEGQQQHHCISTYHDKILSGNYYAYRVTYPERATLGLRKNNNDRWLIDQLALKYNKPPSDPTADVVSSWFNNPML